MHIIGAISSSRDLEAFFTDRAFQGNHQDDSHRKLSIQLLNSINIHDLIRLSTPNKAGYDKEVIEQYIYHFSFQIMKLFSSGLSSSHVSVVLTTTQQEKPTSALSANIFDYTI